MGYLDNTSVTVDAILTKRGRELLAQGDGSFNITKFALADDEIDYRLYDFSHTNGSNFYGEAIERLPLLEAFPDDDAAMRYRLVTLTKNTTQIPIVGAGGATAYTVNSGQGTLTVINPTTTNGVDPTYTATVSDTNVLTIEALGTIVSQPATNQAGNNAMAFAKGSSKGAATLYSTSTTTAPVTNTVVTGTGVSVQGTQFRITPVYNAVEDKVASVTITGNATGGQVVVTFTVLKATI
tara:strand:+ start:1929 stop:2642 length:714 start_codon:yes stop_codon:yes gene_type:complete